MPLSLLLSAFVAAFLYVVIPGPAFIALLGIGAGQGRGAGARFIVGHLAGDTLWTSLALTALVIGSVAFNKMKARKKKNG